VIPVIVAIPTQGKDGLKDQLFGHFGKAPTYTIADIETGDVRVLENTSDHFGGTASPPELIKGAGVDVVAVEHLGAKAAQRCAELGMTVLCGASGSVRDVIEQVKQGSLAPPSASTMCNHHH
jgi:predicted Fe-Mo cluster-binding NifX family protein